MLTAELVRLAWEDPARLVPTLWGPPRQGKTWTLLNEARAYTGSAERVMVWRPAADLPEDIGGLPRVSAGRTYYATPPGIPAACLEAGGRGWALVIDEIDKARPEVLVCLLSLLDHQRSVRDWKLPHLRVAAAGNEPDMPLPEPLLGRMVHLIFPSAEDVAVRLGQYSAMASEENASWLAVIASQLLRPASTPLPQRVSGDDSLTAMLSWSRTQAWDDPDARTRIVQGLYAAKDVPSVLQALECRRLDPERLAGWIAEAPLAQIQARLHTHVAASPAGAATAALAALDARAEADPASEVRRVVDALFTAQGLAWLGPAKDVDAEAASAAWRRGKGRRLDPALLSERSCGHLCVSGAWGLACSKCGGVCDCALCSRRMA